MKQLTVQTSTPYDVLVGSGLIKELGAQLKVRFKGARIFIIMDETVLNLHGDTLLKSLRGTGLTVYMHAFPAGEVHKNHETLMKLYAEMAKRELVRTDAVVAFGGGVVGDMAGFAASTYMRGLPCVMAPTTLLAMADSSIGGKTAVNLPYVKNLVGTFSQPRLVICDTDYLETLPKREYRAGYAEVIKCAAISDAEAFSRLERGDMSDEEAIFMALSVKAVLVEADEFDRGDRRLLNFGHTVGHAVESASGYSLRHGEAVSVGMAAMAKTGERLGITQNGTAARLIALLEAYSLPVKYDGDKRDVIKNLVYDKKTEETLVDAVLLTKIGAAVRHHLKREELLR